jgi:uncharacterized membrane protein YfcA
VVILAAGVLIGTAVGAPVLRRLPEWLFRRILALTLLLLGALLLASAAQAL